MAQVKTKPTKMKLKVGDKVVVIAGKHKGETGLIKTVLPKLNKVVIAGVNVCKKHRKSNPLQQGGIIEITKPIFASKVAIVEPETEKPSRIGYKIRKSGEKVRIYKRTGKPISDQKLAKLSKPKK